MATLFKILVMAYALLRTTDSFPSSRAEGINPGGVAQSFLGDRFRSEQLRRSGPFNSVGLKSGAAQFSSGVRCSPAFLRSIGIPENLIQTYQRSGSSNPVQTPIYPSRPLPQTSPAAQTPNQPPLVPLPEFPQSAPIPNLPQSQSMPNPPQPASFPNLPPLDPKPNFQPPAPLPNHSPSSIRQEFPPFAPMPELFQPAPSENVPPPAPMPWNPPPAPLPNRAPSPIPRAQPFVPLPDLLPPAPMPRALPPALLLDLPPPAPMPRALSPASLPDLPPRAPMPRALPPAPLPDLLPPVPMPRALPPATLPYLPPPTPMPRDLPPAPFPALSPPAPMPRDLPPAPLPALPPPAPMQKDLSFAPVPALPPPAPMPRALPTAPLSDLPPPEPMPRALPPAPLPNFPPPAPMPRVLPPAPLPNLPSPASMPRALPPALVPNLLPPAPIPRILPLAPMPNLPPRASTPNFRPPAPIPNLPQPAPLPKSEFSRAENPIPVAQPGKPIQLSSENQGPQIPSGPWQFNQPNLGNINIPSWSQSLQFTGRQAWQSMPFRWSQFQYSGVPTQSVWQMWLLPSSQASGLVNYNANKGNQFPPPDTFLPLQPSPSKLFLAGRFPQVPLTPGADSDQPKLPADEGNGDPCQDYQTGCSKWSANEGCDSDVWIKNQCPRSCGTCEGQANGNELEKDQSEGLIPRLLNMEPAAFRKILDEQSKAAVSSQKNKKDQEDPSKELLPPDHCSMDLTLNHKMAELQLDLCVEGLVQSVLNEREEMKPNEEGSFSEQQIADRGLKENENAEQTPIWNRGSAGEDPNSPFLGGLEPNSLEVDQENFGLAYPASNKVQN